MMDELSKEAQLQDIYNKFFDLLAQTITEENCQMISGTLMALALRLYKTTLTNEDFEKMIESIQQSSNSVKSFADALSIPSRKIH